MRNTRYQARQARQRERDDRRGSPGRESPLRTPRESPFVGMFGRKDTDDTLAPIYLNPTQPVVVDTQVETSSGTEDLRTWNIPGSGTSYEDGLNLFLQGASFGCKANGDVIMETWAERDAKDPANNDSLGLLLDQFATASNAWLDENSTARGRGSYNNFWNIRRDNTFLRHIFENVYGDTSGTVPSFFHLITSGTRFEAPFSVGVRRSKLAQPLTNVTEARKAWEENFMCFKAFKAGIGVRIMGCVWREYPTQVLEVGVDLDKWIDGIDTIERLGRHHWDQEHNERRYRLGAAAAQSLVDAFTTAGQIGMLLMDLKGGNMVVLNGEVKFIDLGSDFSKLNYTASTSCITFLNQFLFMSYLGCFKGHSWAARGLTSVLRPQLFQVLLPQYSRPVSASKLCGVFMELKRDQVAKEAHNPAGTGLKTTYSPTVLAQNVFFMASWYSQWLRSDSPCHVPPDAKRAMEPAWKVLLQNQLTRLTADNFSRRVLSSFPPSGSYV